MIRTEAIIDLRDVEKSLNQNSGKEAFSLRDIDGYFRFHFFIKTLKP